MAHSRTVRLAKRTKAIQGCFEAGGEIANLPATFCLAAARYLALVLRSMNGPIIPRAEATVAYEIGDRRDRPRALRLVAALAPANRKALQCVPNDPGWRPCPCIVAVPLTAD